MKLTAKNAREISESNLTVLFEVIEKAAKDGYTGIQLSNSGKEHYNVKTRILYRIVSANRKYLKFLDYNIQTNFFGNITEINWRQK